MAEHETCGAHDALMLRLKQGEAHFATIDGKQDKLQATLDKFGDRMFVDNGSPCVQTRLIKLETILGQHQKGLFVIATAVVGVIIRFIWMAITKAG